MKRFFLILITFTCFCFNAFAGDLGWHGNEWTGPEWIGTTTDNLKLRKEPNLKSETITVIKKGEKVTIHSASDNIDTIDDIKSRWFKITSNQKQTGWVFGGYLMLFSDETLQDRTQKENLLPENKWYYPANGKIIKTENKSNCKITVRQFEKSYYVNDYNERSECVLYKDVDEKGIAYKLDSSVEKKFFSEKIYIVEENKSDKTRVYLFGKTDTGKEGYLYVAASDPYDNMNWAVIGTIKVDGKEYLLRNYESIFLTRKNCPVYAAPSEKSQILWKIEVPKDVNETWDIIIKVNCVIEDSVTVNSRSGCWVKVKDSYGRVGWMFDGDLDTGRGGFRYRSPENKIEYAFFAP